jgi:hypothetical protein
VIDPQVFAAEMTLLRERFGKALSQPVLARYYAYLSANLGTEEFQQAAIGIFNEEKFFPAPADFVHRVHGDLEHQAERQWAELMRAIKANERSALSDVGRQALEEIGGRWTIENTGTDKDLGFKRGAFIKAFKAIKNPPIGLQRKELPSTEQAKALLERVSEAADD